LGNGVATKYGIDDRFFIYLVRWDIPLPLCAATGLNYVDLPFWGKVTDHLQHMALPVIVLSIGQTQILLRYLSSTLLTCMQQRYVVTARAKGLHEVVIIMRHALRTGLPALITCIGLQIGGLLSGAAIIESVLGWPGLGRLAIDAVRARDDPLILGILMLVSGLFILGSMVADLLLVWSNPQIRYMKRV
jgi:peptide/nickel transport system permease protein